jgi:transposase
LLRVILGVDTHADFHVAVALDHLGRRLSSFTFSTTTSGYDDLLQWCESIGTLEAVGIEGTGSYGSGLARHLLSLGISVFEVSRPNRQHLRRYGKSDLTDAHAAALSVLSGNVSRPKSSSGFIESIRLLKFARSSALKARTQASNQIHASLVTSPSNLTERLRPLSTKNLLSTISALEVGTLSSPDNVTRLVLRSLALRYLALESEIAIYDKEIRKAVNATCPALLELFGVGVDTASSLLCAIGDNPERLRSESSFAYLCGVAPMSASSGKVVRHRLNRSGNRDANRALHTIALVRMSHESRTQAYVQRRTMEGKSKREIIRCLKRYIVREIYAVVIKYANISENLP